VTVADLIRRNGTDPTSAPEPFLLFGDRTITHAKFYAESIRLARLFLEARDPSSPFHVGVLMDNLPEYLFAFGAAALAGAVVVGINPTQRGASLARDIRHADCQILLTEPSHLFLLEPIREELPLLTESRILMNQRWEPSRSRPFFGRDLDEALDAIDRERDVDPRFPVDPDARYLLVFTSGTTAAPKAVSISQRRMVSTGEYIGGLMGVGRDDCGYLAMPLFHANSQQCGFMPALLHGARLGLIRKFSKSQFLPDVRRYGVTYFNYTGKPLSYILTTPRRPDDAENPLRVAYGNEGSHRVVAEFAERFGCRVIDGFGATEGGFGFPRTPDDPPGSVGRPPESIQVLREDRSPCPAAILDERGVIMNPEEAIGEIVNTSGIGKFEGYYKNEEATRQRTRGGMYWSGDFGYKDRAGYVYFTGRALDWIRVDGENFLAKPIEDALGRHPAIYVAAVYAVPDSAAGDRVMATIVAAEDAPLDPRALYDFLLGEPDFSPKWLPTYLRLAREVPMTATNKVLVRELRRQKFRLEEVADPIWWRERGDTIYKPFTRNDYERVVAEFRATGREHLLAI
jgi:fatty-acyl-CoA synthase